MFKFRRLSFRKAKRFWHRLRKARRVRLNGVLLSTNPNDVPAEVCDAIFRGVYESEEAKLVQKYLKPGDRVLEIGVGIGYISLLCAKICGEENVHSFEANPLVAPVIRTNYALNGISPQLQMKAVTVEGAPLEFHVADNIISSSIIDRHLTGRKLRVESTALNDVLEGIEPTVIVIDVEGAEIALMETARLDNIQLMIMEIHPHIVGEPAVNDMLDKLEQKGFALLERVGKNVLLKREAAI